MSRVLLLALIAIALVWFWLAVLAPLPAAPSVPFTCDPSSVYTVKECT